MCAVCFEAKYGEEPEMGCEAVSFAPGRCACGMVGVVFRVVI